MIRTGRGAVYVKPQGGTWGYLGQAEGMTLSEADRRYQGVALFAALALTDTPHRFAPAAGGGAPTQCTRCFGWYDDYRHH